LEQATLQLGHTPDPLTDLLKVLSTIGCPGLASTVNAARAAVDSLGVPNSPDRQTIEQSAPPQPQPVVELRGSAQKPIINGVEVEPLSQPRYAVVKALLAAGPDGLSKSELERVKGDAVKYLRELSKLLHWQDAINMAGTPWQRYSIKHR
jgi:hypothetical protein